MAPTIDEIVVADHPDRWRAAGFTVDPDAGCRVGRVRIRLVGREHGRRIQDWSLRDLTPGTALTNGLDGLPTRTSAAPAVEPADHANGVILIDHLVLATPDPARTTAVFEAAGLVARRTRPSDTYGTPLLQTFFRAGEVIVELIGPQEPAGDGPTAFFGLAYTVADLDATVARLGEHVGAPKDAVQTGRRIATLRHRDLDLSVATAFLSPEPGPSPTSAAGLGGETGGEPGGG